MKKVLIILLTVLFLGTALYPYSIKIGCKHPDVVNAARRQVRDGLSWVAFIGCLNKTGHKDLSLPIDAYFTAARYADSKYPEKIKKFYSNITEEEYKAVRSCLLLSDRYRDVVAEKYDIYRYGFYKKVSEDTIYCIMYMRDKTDNDIQVFIYKVKQLSDEDIYVNTFYIYGKTKEELLQEMDNCPLY